MEQQLSFSRARVCPSREHFLSFQAACEAACDRDETLGAPQEEQTGDGDREERETSRIHGTFRVHSNPYQQTGSSLCKGGEVSHELPTPRLPGDPSQQRRPRYQPPDAGHAWERRLQQGRSRLSASLVMKAEAATNTRAPASSASPTSNPPSWAPGVLGENRSTLSCAGRAQLSVSTTMRTSAVAMAATNTGASNSSVSVSPTSSLPSWAPVILGRSALRQTSLAQLSASMTMRTAAGEGVGWERKKKSKRVDGGRKHGHEEHSERYPLRDGPVPMSGDRSLQFRLRSRSRGRSRSRDQQLDWSSRRKEEKSPRSGTNNRGHGRRSWSNLSREESTVVHRSAMQEKIEGPGRGWDHAQGQHRQQGRVGRERGATSMQGRGPDFRTCHTVLELADLARCNLDKMSNRDIAAFWSILPRLARNRGDQDPNLEENMRCVIGITCNRMHSFQCRDLAQTSLGIAKTISQVKRGNQQYHAEDDPFQIIQGLFLKDFQSLMIFDSIASSSAGMLDKFETRHLSNLIYSFGLVELNPEIGGDTLFNVFGKTAIKILRTFKPQALSNVMWAFVKVGAKNSRLFRETGGVISGMDLDSFKPQALANILWSFAKSGEADPELFQVLGNHIVVRSLNDFWPQDISNIAWAYANGRVPHPILFKKIGDLVAGQDSLDSFKPQELSNTAWAFATAGVLHPELFKKIGGHVAGLSCLGSFKPQALSNTAWAFATTGDSNPKMFKKIRDHIVRLDNLDSFTPQELSNIAWAYATARRFDLGLFEKLVTGAVAKKDRFGEQATSNFLWACATIGYTDGLLFSAFAPVIASTLDKYGEQHLANIAWAYSVANAPRQDLFNEGYVGSLALNRNHISDKELAQLHQWQLWQQELESGIELPRSLQAKCRYAFTSQGHQESKLQDDVVGELRAAGLDLEEEFLLGSGYRIDALVTFSDGRKVAVEVDGPSHFIDRRPTGSAVLKHRQVVRLDRIEVVSVPHWEWNELKNSEMKQNFLRVKLCNGC
ncbi:hypothetical protein THAOC_02564 [Thalassiosira oceanica]|uniref:RAP domain-containing protein n=1 Tax=Thalassiosira oceanica TaxID=159749 RepID=K0TLY4_THAOC|nr:hypothetical protein THAOC_02564 [Thalassiosira oceanica]|eukprot:EJK75706.1 hypothetical protein THAOC_02564 [Thalassiosira oceanica]